MAEVRSGSFSTTGYSDAYSPDYYVFSWSLSSQSIVDNTQRDSARLEQATALLNDGKQTGKRETLDLQVHISLAHLYPALKDNVQVIEFFGKFGDVNKFALGIGC